MIIIKSPLEMRRWADQKRATNNTIGLVPTMGALHRGHMSLVEAAVRENDMAVASIFVNPTQFAPHEDFDHYPRTFEKDCELLKEAGVACVYAPTAGEMYSQDFSTWVDVELVSEGLCGGSRPHFFRGVATVVMKLFHATKPQRAYFGQKDAQQCAVIRRMVRDMDMGIDIVEMPIVREADGLAMSSRNAYLTDDDRERALCLSRALFAVGERLRQGEREAAVMLESVREAMREVEIDYVVLADADTMQPVSRVEGRVVLAVAALLPTARLIDNIIYDPTENTVS
ncbi:MAG: pantoate--beta-alanine ligase [Candidatus Hydrogenedens sp.]|jgi:pantoate--beta-alanine ligase|nr:pantoate--beta-alanine ligase [Candidatus Hydrogenedens sp.]